MNPDAGLVYSYYKDGAMAPTFVYIKAGYKISKVRKGRVGVCGTGKGRVCGRGDDVVIGRRLCVSLLMRGLDYAD